MAKQELYTAKDVFVAVFTSAVVREVPFDQKWNNNTGYMDGAVRADLGLKPGEIVRSSTPAPNSRKLILIGTPVGNICVFERYTNGQNDVYVANAPMCCERLFGLGSKISAESMAHMFGQVVGGEYFSEFNMTRVNAGIMLEDVANALEHA